MEPLFVPGRLLLAMNLLDQASWIDIVVASGVVGTLVTAVANLFVSTRTLRAQRSLAKQKVALGLQRERLEALRQGLATLNQSRYTLDDIVKVVPLYSPDAKPHDVIASYHHFANTVFVPERNLYMALNTHFSPETRSIVTPLFEDAVKTFQDEAVFSVRHRMAGHDDVSLSHAETVRSALAAMKRFSDAFTKGLNTDIDGLLKQLRDGM